MLSDGAIGFREILLHELVTLLQRAAIRFEKQGSRGGKELQLRCRGRELPCIHFIQHKPLFGNLRRRQQQIRQRQFAMFFQSQFIGLERAWNA